MPTDRLTPHFRLDEFRCPCCKRVIEIEAQPLAERLELIRGEYGPMVVVSGYRCPCHNRRTKGSKNSQHMLGKAADILCTDDGARFHLVSLAIVHGFTRIGIAKRAVHLDHGYWLDPSKNHPVLWHYY